VLFLLKQFDESVLNFQYILFNNLRVVFLLSFGGTLTFGVLTFLNLLFNTLTLGAMFYFDLTSDNLREFFFLILPHGVFEIPGLIIAGSAGFKLPYELLRFALGKKNEIISEEDAKEFFKLVGISILLIFIAAVIESTITSKLATSLVE
ncbi:stage II sporulation protein M, partial [Thermococcus sp. GR7]